MRTLVVTAEPVQDRLHNVQHIQSGFRAFAAILDDGSVVTWGDPRYGGDCSAVQHQLKNVPRSDISTLILTHTLFPHTVWSFARHSARGFRGVCCGTVCVFV